MTALAVSFAKIAASLALMGILLYAVSLLVRRARLDAEIARKTIHVSLGLYCLVFPWLFTHVWEVAFACAGAVALLLLARFPFRATLGAGLYSVERRSLGDIYFTIAVLCLFIARETHGRSAALPADLVYVAPLLVLTFGDAAAALIGTRFGRVRFTVGQTSKSMEGVCAFFVAACIALFAALAQSTSMNALDALRLSAAAAAAGAALEAVSERGLDNLTAPLGAYLVLAFAAPNGGFNFAMPAAFVLPF